MTELTNEQKQIREILIEVAKIGRPIWYSDLIERAGLNLNTVNPAHRKELGHLLGAISTYEHENNRPMLSSVVVSKETLMPSKGFYKLAEELGNGNWQTLKETYWGIEEMNRAFKFWQNSNK